MNVTSLLTFQTLDLYPVSFPKGTRGVNGKLELFASFGVLYVNKKKFTLK